MSDEKNAPIGRPKAEINAQQLEALMRLMPRLQDVAAFFQVCERTIERHIREHFDLSFVEFREQRGIHTRLNIQRKAIQMATDGNVALLIFALKNLCGWTDKGDGEVQVNIQNNVNQNVNIETFDLEDRIKQIKGEEK